MYQDFILGQVLSVENPEVAQSQKERLTLGKLQTLLVMLGFKGFYLYLPLYVSYLHYSYHLLSWRTAGMVLWFIIKAQSTMLATYRPC